MKNQFLLALSLSLHFSMLSAQTPKWQHIPGPDGGDIENFDLDGTVLYALSKAGIYRSEDEGYHWQLLTQSLGSTRDKRQLRAEKGVFYALNTEGSLVRSDDQGATWKPVLQKPFPINFENERLHTFFVKGDTILVGSLFAIYRSTNRGETWAATADVVPASFVSIFEFKNEIFAAQDRYIYRSADGGLTWETVFTNAVGYAAVTATDSFLFAFYGNRTRLVRSSDGLRTWDVIDTDTIAKHIYEDSYSKWVGADGNNLYYFQRMDNNYYCPIRFCYSTDGGDSWNRGNNGDEVSIGWAFNDGILFGEHLLLSTEKLYHSTDKAQIFFEEQAGLKTAAIRQIIHHGASIFSNTNWTSAQFSIDGGETWSEYARPAFWEQYCLSGVWFDVTKEKVFRTQDHPFEQYYSLDDGSTWKPFNTPEYYYQAETDHALWLVDLSWQNGNYLYQFWKIADGDTLLKPIHLFNFNPEEQVDRVIGLGDRLAVVFLNKQLIFDEKGAQIQELPASPCLIPFGWNGSLHFANNTYYNFCNDRCYIFPPNATDWQEIYPQDWTTGIPLYHSTMTFFEAHDGIIWVGLEGKGLFYATDNTGRFYPAQPQMPFPYPTAISFYENDLWVGTDGGGIWTYPVPKTLIDPAKNTVFKVFPNPSNGALNLQSDQFVKEEFVFLLLDASGRRIAKKVLSPGQYWSLDFPNLPKGLYFLQMRAESGVFGLKWVVEN